jgi:uncharacterized protein YeaO (DUF488 family)
LLNLVKRNAREKKELEMAVRIVRLGTDRTEGEGIRIGTVRRPPRGVPKSKYASGNWYDVWFPTLAPSPETMKLAKTAQTEKQRNSFLRKYKAEMATPEIGRTLELLAAFSRQTDFSIGCYCGDERFCHISVLRDLLLERGAEVK